MKILEGAAHPEMWKFTEKSSSTRPRSDGKSKQSRSFATKQRRSDHPADPSRRGFKKKLKSMQKKEKETQNGSIQLVRCRPSLQKLIWKDVIYTFKARSSSCAFLPIRTELIHIQSHFIYRKTAYLLLAPHRWRIFTSRPAASSSMADTEFSIPHHRLHSAGDTCVLFFF